MTVNGINNNISISNARVQTERRKILDTDITNPFNFLSSQSTGAPIEISISEWPKDISSSLRNLWLKYFQPERTDKPAQPQQKQAPQKPAPAKPQTAAQTQQPEAERPANAINPKTGKPTEKYVNYLFRETSSQSKPLAVVEDELAQEAGDEAYKRVNNTHINAIRNNERAQEGKARVQAGQISNSDFNDRVEILTSQLDLELQKKIADINHSPANPAEKAKQIKATQDLYNKLLADFKKTAAKEKSQLEHDILYEDSSRTSTNLFQVWMSKVKKRFFPDSTSGTITKIENAAKPSIDALTGKDKDAAALAAKKKAIAEARAQLKEDIPEDVAETFFLVANHMDVLGLCSGGVSESLSTAGLDDGNKLKGQANLAPEKLNKNKYFKSAKVTEDLLLNPPEGTLFVFKDAFTSEWKQFGHIEMIVSNRAIKDSDGKEVGRRIFESSDHISEYRLSNPENLDKLWKRDKNGNVMYENVVGSDGQMKRSRVVDTSKILAYTLTPKIKCDGPDCMSPAKKALIQEVPKQIDSLIYRVNHPRTQHIQDKFYNGYSKTVDVPSVLIERITKLQEIETKHSEIIYSKNNPEALQNIPGQISKLMSELGKPHVSDAYRQMALARIAKLQGYETSNSQLIFNQNSTNVLQNIPKDISALLEEYKETKDDNLRGIIKDRVTFLENIEENNYSSIYNKDHMESIKAVPTEIRNVLKEYKEVLKKDGYDDYKKLLKQRFYKLLGFEGNKFYLLYNEQKYTLPGFQEQMRDAVNSIKDNRTVDDDYKGMVYAQYGMLMHISTTEGNSVYDSKTHPRHKGH